LDWWEPEMRGYGRTKNTTVEWVPRRSRGAALIDNFDWLPRGFTMLKREFRWPVLALAGATLLLCTGLLSASPQDPPSRDDNAITTSIQAKLFQDPSLKTQDIHVSTKDGVVTLTGTVDTAEQQAAVDRIASLEPGVVKVIDSLAVGEPSAPSSTAAPNQTPASQPAARPARSRTFGEAAQDETIPPSMTLSAGTLVTVRMSQEVSTDHNKPGDMFTATLDQPVVVNGWVVARRGQTVAGTVTVVKKGGRVSGVSQLGLALNELTLVNGNQVPVRTTLVQASGGPSKARDAAAIGTTTSLGAVIGAIAGEGEGAGIGAAAGAAAGVAGVLLTRGRPAVIPPEAQLTFRLETSASFSTVPGQAAFRPVTQADYAQEALEHRPGRYYPRRPPYPPCCAPPVYWGYYGWPAYYAPYWVSPGWYYGPGFVTVFNFREHGRWHGGHER